MKNNDGSKRILSRVDVAFMVGIPIVVWYAVSGNVPAGNVVKLIATLTVILLPVAMLSIFAGPGKPRPRWRDWLSNISDAIVVGLLVWHGWFWCSLAFSLGWIASVVMFMGRRAAVEKEANEA